MTPPRTRHRQPRRYRGRAGLRSSRAAPPARVQVGQALQSYVTKVRLIALQCRHKLFDRCLLSRLLAGSILANAQTHTVFTNGSEPAADLASDGSAAWLAVRSGRARRRRRYHNGVLVGQRVCQAGNAGGAAGPIEPRARPPRGELPAADCCRELPQRRGRVGGVRSDFDLRHAAVVDNVIAAEEVASVSEPRACRYPPECSVLPSNRRIGISQDVGQ